MKKSVVLKLLKITEIDDIEPIETAHEITTEKSVARKGKGKKSVKTLLK